MQSLNRNYLWWLIVMGLIEGTSTLVLFFIAMPLKYVADMPMAVSVVGSVHGFLFLGLVMMFLIGKSLVPLSWGLTVLGLIGAIIPFGPFLVDIKLVRMLREDKARTAPADLQK